MTNRALTTALAAAALGLAACGGSDSSSSSTPTPTADASAGNSGSGSANTAEVVSAANAFLKTLSAKQRGTATYAFADKAKMAGWSNFPAGFAARAGVPFVELNTEQREAALAVMEAALSEQGQTRLAEIRDADAYLAEQPDDGAAGGGAGGPPSGGSGGGGAGEDVAGTATTETNFDRNNYFIAFFGEPSETGRFMLQYGGHHLAYNLTYEGDTVSMSPSLTAVEPPKFDLQGRTYEPLKDENEAAFGAIESLSDSELAKARINGSFDLLLGPGNDGPFPVPAGIRVSDLSADQQAKVEEMLRVWVGDLHEPAAEALVEKYMGEMDETYLGWSGSTERTSEAYIRLDGPAAWIEFSNQAADADPGYHHHTIFRDETADYGA